LNVNLYHTHGACLNRKLLGSAPTTEKEVCRRQ